MATKIFVQARLCYAYLECLNDFNIEAVGFYFISNLDFLTLDASFSSFIVSVIESLDKDFLDNILCPLIFNITVPNYVQIMCQFNDVRPDFAD